MRSLLLGVLICCFAEYALAQCPVQARHASIDPSGKNVAIRYYNSGSRAVQAVEFTLKGPRSGQNEPAALARYSAGETIQPKAEKTAFFQRPAEKSDDIGEAAQVEELEVQVTRVVFTDQSTWRPTSEDTCKIPLSLH
jgi:hypothetical protein